MIFNEILWWWSAPAGKDRRLRVSLDASLCIRCEARIFRIGSMQPSVFSRSALHHHMGCWISIFFIYHFCCEVTLSNLYIHSLWAGVFGECEHLLTRIQKQVVWIFYGAGHEKNGRSGKTYRGASRSFWRLAIKNNPRCVRPLAAGV